MFRRTFISAMGFPVGCSEIILPKLLLNVVYVLVCITSAVYRLLRFLGFREFLEPETSWPAETNPPSKPVSSSVLAQRIRERLPVVRFGVLAEEAGGADVMCAVCLNNMERHEEIRRLRNCSHIFHRECVDKWVDHDQNACPLCRSPFLSTDDIEHKWNKNRGR